MCVGGECRKTLPGIRTPGDLRPVTFPPGLQGFQGAGSLSWQDARGSELAAQLGSTRVAFTRVLFLHRRC